VVVGGALYPRDQGGRPLGKVVWGGGGGREGGTGQVADDPVRGWDLARAAASTRRRPGEFRRAASGKIALNPSGGRGEIASGRASSKRADRRAPIDADDPFATIGDVRIRGRARADVIADLVVRGRRGRTFSRMPTNRLYTMARWPPSTLKREW